VLAKLCDTPTPGGFSTPIFGVSWDPPTVDRSVARKVIAYLEDRRVLYSPPSAKEHEDCVQTGHFS
jgi:hypothetical protein